jgi:hypothetical protein
MELSRLAKIVAGGALWGLVVLGLTAFLDPTPENLTLAVSISLSGLYTVLLYFTRKYWLKNLLKHPEANAILLGSLNAAVIETLFLVVEKAFGAAGVAAHPNLVFDLALTMPWYIGMVWIFVKIQKNERFPLPAVLLLGAVYELGADGFLGGLVMPALMGTPVNLVEFLPLLFIVAFWQFIPVYSSLVLPSAWILEQTLPDLDSGRKRWGRAFLPLLVLIPYSLYLIIVLLMIDLLGS